MPRMCSRLLQSCMLSAALAGTAGLAPTQALEGDYKKVDFFYLTNFDYNVKEKWDPTPHKVAKAPIPDFVRALDGQRIAIYGATMPLDFKSGKVSEFILGVSVDTCEFGATPRINEWIAVTMAGGKKTQVYASGDGWVRGVFHVNEMVESGRVVRLYNIDGDSVGN